MFERNWINLINGRRFCREEDGAVTYENAYQGASMTFSQEDWLNVVIGVARPDIDPAVVRNVVEQVHAAPIPEPVPVVSEPLLAPAPDPDLSGLAATPPVDSGDLTPGEG